MDGAANGSVGFSFHPKCQTINLTHLCFADDLLIFSAANYSSVGVVKKVLDEFECLSGLKANPEKSSFFSARLNYEEKNCLLELLRMKEGSLPVRYLGVPLTTKQLSAADCAVLVERITAKMNSWPVKHLSFAGRLQLLTSILFSIQIFWSRVFILPMKIIHLIEQKFNRFLWSGKDLKDNAKVAWNRVCTPKSEGGLGIKSLALWNKVSMLKPHLVSLFQIWFIIGGLGA
jgi:hypothetical protein